MFREVHKYFLQFILQRSYIPIDKALEFCKTCDDEIDNLNALKDFIVVINEKIGRQSLKIVLTKCEVTGSENLVLANTANDEVAKLQNSFTGAELEYFQYLLKEIITNEEHKLSNIACMNLSNSLTRNLRKDDVEELLEKWTELGYLVQKDSLVYLGARCILEFAAYFRTHCKDYYMLCQLCSEPAFIGQTCTSCDKLIHNHCIEKWLIRQKNCPNCKKPWQQMNRRSRVADDSSSEDEVTPSQRKRLNDSSIISDA